MRKPLILSFAMWSYFGIADAVPAPLEPVAVIIKNPKGEQIGDLNLTQEDQGVKMNLNLQGLSPGTYSASFHEKGTCKAPGFQSAGAYFPSRPEAPESTLKNIEVLSDGTGHIETRSKAVTLKDGPNSLLKGGGTAIVIYERSEGKADKRIACGEIKTPDRTKTKTK